jgi:hypothetical protein
LEAFVLATGALTLELLELSESADELSFLDAFLVGAAALEGVAAAVADFLLVIGALSSELLELSESSDELSLLAALVASVGLAAGDLVALAAALARGGFNTGPANFPCAGVGDFRRAGDCEVLVCA